ncbi:hypothetical protein PROFUN_13087 [Planoprotostelium fungivorum]|uniref:Ras-GAP domain-containing protein n=1 Tax=Planoprotostelium fungivorum TaxID=1890364 RepID=A0A2P6N5I5_9EUKA|nr:hypothetical protein PROFUN_13087 [Planoprotostelium fungivorum]
MPKVSYNRPMLRAMLRLLVGLCVAINLVDGYGIGNITMIGTIPNSSMLAFQLAPPYVAFNYSGANVAKSPYIISQNTMIVSAAIHYKNPTKCSALLWTFNSRQMPQNQLLIVWTTDNVFTAQLTSPGKRKLSFGPKPNPNDIIRDPMNPFQPVPDSVTTVVGRGFYYLATGGIYNSSFDSTTINTVLNQPGSYNQFVPLNLSNTVLEFDFTVSGVGFGLTANSSNTKSSGYFLIPSLINTTASAGDQSNRVRYWITEGYNVYRHNQGGSPQLLVNNSLNYDVMKAGWDSGLNALVIATRNSKSNTSSWAISKVYNADCGSYGRECQACLGSIDGSVDSGDSFYCSYNITARRCVPTTLGPNMAQNSGQCPYIMGNSSVQGQVGTSTQMNVTVPNGLNGTYSCSFINIADRSITYTPAIVLSTNASALVLNCTSPLSGDTATYNVGIVSSVDNQTYATNTTYSYYRYVRQACVTFADAASCISTASCTWCNAAGALKDPIVVSAIQPNYTFVDENTTVVITGYHFWPGATYVFLLRRDETFPAVLSTDLLNGSGVAINDSTIVGHLTSGVGGSVYLQLYRNRNLVDKPLSVTSKSCSANGDCDTCMSHSSCIWCTSGCTTRSDANTSMCLTSGNCSVITPTLSPLFCGASNPTTLSLTLWYTPTESLSLYYNSTNGVKSDHTPLMLTGKRATGGTLSTTTPSLREGNYTISIYNETELLVRLPQTFTVYDCSSYSCLTKGNHPCYTILQCTSSNLAPNNGGDSSKMVGILAGAIGGGVALLLIILLIVVIVMRRRRSGESEEISMERAMPAKPNLSLFVFERPTFAPTVNDQQNSSLLQLEKMLLNDDFAYTSGLVRSVRTEDMAEFSRAYMYIALHRCRQKGFDLFSFVLRDDITSNRDLINDTTASASMFGVYARCSDLDFLWDSIARVVWDVIRNFEDTVTDDTKATMRGKDTFVDDHVYTLLMLLSKAFNGLRKSTEKLSGSTRAALAKVRDISGTGKKMMTLRLDAGELSPMEKKCLGGCFFKEFVVPALVNPHLWGICEGPVNYEVQRSLDIIGDVLLHLASNTMPSWEAPKMKKFDQFVIDNTARLTKYYDSITNSSKEDKDEKNFDVPEDAYMTALIWMHDYIFTNKDRLTDPHMQKLKMNLSSGLIAIARTSSSYPPTSDQTQSLLDK